MEFNFMAPGLSTDEVNEAVAKSSPRVLADPGRYKVKLINVKGRKYTKDGVDGELATIFFGIQGGNYKGAELTLFRLKDGSGGTTNPGAVISIGVAAGLTADQIKDLNWAVSDEAADERGNLKAAFGSEELGPISVEGLEFSAVVDIKTNEKTGYQNNVIKYLNAPSK